VITDLIYFLEGLPHLFKRGHWPSWYLLGAGQRQCINCLKGGHRQPLLRPLEPRLLPRPLL
jgi:hypothetical protein